MNLGRIEMEPLDIKLLGVMHFVDKWLDGEDLKLDEVNRAARMREVTLKITEGMEKEISTQKTENQKLRDTLEWILREYGYAWNIPSINKVRAALGLPELEDSHEQNR